MPLYQAVVLAVVQGLTEFLPVSSTAHLTLFPWLLGWKDPGLTFDLALHTGTLAAVLIYFWRLWVELLGAAIGFGKAQSRRLFWYLVIGTAPAGIAGWRFEHAAEAELRQPMLIGTALTIVGLMMWAADRMKTRQRALGQVNLADALVVGAAQALAVIPGVSRSGITMTAGLFRGVSRETAARFSFLLSTPIIAGAGLKKGIEIHHQGLPEALRLPFLVGTLVAAVVGYFVIAVLIRYLERHTFRIFVVYRIIAGVVVLALGWSLRHA